MAKVILDVPKIKNLVNYCVPTSLAMVFQYFGYDNTQEEIAEWFGYNITSSGGVTKTEIVDCANAHGFVTHSQEDFGLEGIINMVNGGLPIITITKDIESRFTTDGAAHAVVVRGYRTNPDGIWINDPRNLAINYMPYNKFAKDWCFTKNNEQVNQYGLVLQE